jgi:integrase
LKKTILEIEVRGKRGVGYCKSMPGAVLPFKRLRSRPHPARVYGVHTPTEPSETSTFLGKGGRTPEATGLIVPKWQRELFKKILDEQKLRFDREGRPRMAYSLRHTYICLRLMEGADIYQIAKNCRTSVEMIEKYYAAHIKTSLDAAAINVMRKKRNKVEDNVETPTQAQTGDQETDV